MSLPLWSIPGIAIILWMAWLFERRHPVEPNLLRVDVLMDWKLAGIRIAIDQFTGPLLSVFGVSIIDAAGGGWFQLRTDGLWFVLSVVMVVGITDFLSYLIHRASHEIPFLWALHSLHHSAESLSIITGARHFWLEDSINTAAFWVVGIVFKMPTALASFVALIYVLPCALTHMNARLSLGRFALIVNNPQYHRIHHSIEPQHWNKNFCQMLPLFDVIFGTVWKPTKNEFPATGLMPRESAPRMLDGLIWPIRHNIARMRSDQSIRVSPEVAVPEA